MEPLRLPRFFCIIVILSAVVVVSLKVSEYIQTAILAAHIPSPIASQSDPGIQQESETGKNKSRIVAGEKSVEKSIGLLTEHTTPQGL